MGQRGNALEATASPVTASDGWGVTCAQVVGRSSILNPPSSIIHLSFVVLHSKCSMPMLMLMLMPVLMLLLMFFLIIIRIIIFILMSILMPQNEK